MTLLVISALSLAIILVLSVVMAVSCYDAGIVGTMALAAMGISAWIVLVDLQSYELSLPTVVLEAGAAVFLGRHYMRFQRYRRQRRCADLGVWPAISGERRKERA